MIGVLGTGVTKEAVDKNPVSLGQRGTGVQGQRRQRRELPVHCPGRTEDVDRRDVEQAAGRVLAIGSDRPYHDIGSGKFFVRLGDALAAGMVELRKKQKR